MEVVRNVQHLILEYLKIFPVVGILGPRQVGKTTLAKGLHTSRPSHYLDLETNADRAKLGIPTLYLQNYAQELIILDEIQFMPELFSELRSMIDLDRRPGKYLILGSASPHLIRKSADSLAGRVGYIELPPFLLPEIGVEHENQLWVRGGFPPSFLASSDEDSLIWRKSFIKTYIEKDLSLLGLQADPRVIGRFWRMVASMNGNMLNVQNLSRSMGLSVATINKYLDFIEGAFLIRRLEPYYINISKRLVKSPKIYVRDSGILHAFSDLYSIQLLMNHSSVGASWEGFIIEQIIQMIKDSAQVYYFRTHQGAEADLLIVRHEVVLAAIEIKLSDAPTISKGLRIVMEDTRALHGYVLAKVARAYEADASITVSSPADFILHHLPGILSA